MRSAEAGGGGVKAREVSAVLASAILVAALLAGVRLTAATPPDLPESGPAPGSRLAQIGLDSEGHATYGYVPAVEDEPPLEVANDDCVRTAQKYRDELRGWLEAATPYEYWKLYAYPEGYPASSPPFAFKAVSIYVFVRRDKIVATVRRIAEVTMKHDSRLDRIDYIFCSPTAMYGEGLVRAEDMGHIDWEKAATDLQDRGERSSGGRGTSSFTENPALLGRQCASGCCTAARVSHSETCGRYPARGRRGSLAGPIIFHMWAATCSHREVRRCS
jgi:hypothetical protein